MVYIGFIKTCIALDVKDARKNADAGSCLVVITQLKRNVLLPRIFFETKSQIKVLIWRHLVCFNSFMFNHRQFNNICCSFIVD